MICYLKRRASLAFARPSLPLLLVAFSLWQQAPAADLQYINQRPAYLSSPGYQWRPITPEQDLQGQQPVKGRVATFRDGADILQGRGNTTMGLPPGVYRPLEQAQPVARQFGNYRFRKILPEEQALIDRQQRATEQGRQSWQSSESGLRAKQSKAWDWGPNRGIQPRFRPDDRLPGPRGQAGVRYGSKGFLFREMLDGRVDGAAERPSYRPDESGRPAWGR